MSVICCSGVAASTGLIQYIILHSSVCTIRKTYDIQTLKDINPCEEGLGMEGGGGCTAQVRLHYSPPVRSILRSLPTFYPLTEVNVQSKSLEICENFRCL
jgi:hypothetical protein